MKTAELSSACVCWMLVIVGEPASAQTRSTRDAATAYGARLTAKGVPADLNQYRVNNRIENRIDNRLALRIERYRPESADNPTGAYAAMQNDKTRAAPILGSAEQDAAQQYDQQLLENSEQAEYQQQQGDQQQSTDNILKDTKSPN